MPAGYRHSDAVTGTAPERLPAPPPSWRVVVLALIAALRAPGASARALASDSPSLFIRYSGPKPLRHLIKGGDRQDGVDGRPHFFHAHVSLRVTRTRRGTAIH